MNRKSEIIHTMKLFDQHDFMSVIMVAFIYIYKYVLKNSALNGYHQAKMFFA